MRPNKIKQTGVTILRHPAHVSAARRRFLRGLFLLMLTIGSLIALSSMATQQKTSAIQNIIANHQDNVNAANAAQINPGLNPYVLEAMNTAFQADRSKLLSR